jgi:hypothetical protein
MVAGDADGVRVPMCVLSGPRENKKVLEAYLNGLGGDIYRETFERMYHGWMGGRNPLMAQADVEEFRRGFEVLLWWFGKTMGGV